MILTSGPRGTSLLISLRNQPARSIRIQLVMKRLQADVQQLSSFRLVVAGLIQRPQDHLPFDLFQRRSDWEGDCVFGAQSLSLFERIWRKVMTFDLLS